MIFFKIEHTQSTHHFCLACLLSFDEQPGWAERVRRLGVSILEKNYIFGILMKNCTKYVSPSQFHDVEGTPNWHIAECKVIDTNSETEKLNITTVINKVGLWEVAAAAIKDKYNGSYPIFINHTTATNQSFTFRNAPMHFLWYQLSFLTAAIAWNHKKWDWLGNENKIGWQNYSIWV